MLYKLPDQLQSWSRISLRPHPLTTVPTELFACPTSLKLFWSMTQIRTKPVLPWMSTWEITATSVTCQVWPMLLSIFSSWALKRFEYISHLHIIVMLTRLLLSVSERKRVQPIPDCSFRTFECIHCCDFDKLLFRNRGQQIGGFDRNIRTSVWRSR
jgi:hypothetical protein